MMNGTRCPYLGLKEDPTTSLGFPSKGNNCFKTRPVSTIKPSHQQNYCLSSDHVSCPIYRLAKTRSMPPALAFPVKEKRVWRKVAAVAGVILLLGLVGVSAAAFNLAQRWPGFERLSLIPNTGKSSQDAQSGWQIFNFENTTRTPFSLEFFGDQRDSTQNPCLMPASWTTYTVNPTDSLLRLSVVFGISESDLRNMNCLADDDVILPGQVIYVPILPTKTPSIPPVVTNSPFSLEPSTTPQTVFRPDIFGQPANTATQALPEPTDTSAPLPTATSTSNPTITIIIPTITNPPLPTATMILPSSTLPPPTQTPTRFPTRRPLFPTATSVPDTLTPLPSATNTPVSDPTNQPTDPIIPTVEPTDDLEPTIQPSDPFVPTVQPTELAVATSEPTNIVAPTIQSTEPPIPIIEPSEPVLPSVQAADPLLHGLH